MQQGAQPYTVVEHRDYYVVVDQSTGEEIIVSKEEPRLVAALAHPYVRLQVRS